MSRAVYVYRPKHPLADQWGFVDTRDLGDDGVREESHVPVVGDAHYDGLRATDGTPIDTKQRHREYMRRNGLALADDFKDEWAKAKRERESPRKDAARRETVARAWYEHVEKGKPRRKP